jgi:hypothetical protein
MPVYLDIDDWLDSSYFPNGCLEFVRSGRQQWNNSPDIEWSFAPFCLCLIHDFSYLFHALMRKFRIIPISSCSRLWQWYRNRPGKCSKRISTRTRSPGMTNTVSFHPSST